MRACVPVWQELSVSSPPRQVDRISISAVQPWLVHGRESRHSSEGRAQRTGRAFPVFKGETVPVERVRPDKDVVRDEETVSEEVRKEHIDTNGIDDDRR